jgi:hypothetical protein
MRGSLRLLVGAAAMLSLSAVVAKADIFVGVCTGAACAPGTIASNTTNAPVAFSFTTADGAWSGTGTAALTGPPATFGSTSLDITQSAGPFPSTLNVFVSGTGVNQANLTGILSAFTMLSLPAGWTATEQTFASTTNTAYATGTLLATTGVQNGPMPPGFLKDVLTAFNPNGLPFSVTEEYTITAPAASTSGQFSGDIHMTAVPGPVVGAGLPGLITVCAGLLALARRRRNNAIA